MRIPPPRKHCPLCRSIVYTDRNPEAVRDPQVSATGRCQCDGRLWTYQQSLDRWRSELPAATVDTVELDDDDSTIVDTMIVQAPFRSQFDTEHVRIYDFIQLIARLLGVRSSHRAKLPWQAQSFLDDLGLRISDWWDFRSGGDRGDQVIALVGEPPDEVLKGLLAAYRYDKRVSRTQALEHLRGRVRRMIARLEAEERSAAA